MANRRLKAIVNHAASLRLITSGSEWRNKQRDFSKVSGETFLVNRDSVFLLFGAEAAFAP